MKRTVITLALALIASQTQAQSYPSRQIRLIASGTPGTGTDVLSRAVAQRLSERLKQSVVVENRPGAGGNIAGEAGAKATPDGYTLLMGTNATHAANPAMYAKMPYDPIADFAPIAMVGMLPMLMSANPGFEASNVRAVVEAARAKPNSLNVAMPSSSARISLELFKQLSGVDLFPVNYKGSGPAFVDLFAGRIQLTIDTVSASLPHVAAGKLKPLAVTTAQRFPAIPDVPTMAESGIAGFDIAPWNALMAPRGTPREAITLINGHVVALLAEPEMRKRLTDLGILPVTGTPEELGAFVQAELRKWGDLVRQAKITAE